MKFGSIVRGLQSVKRGYMAQRRGQPTPLLSLVDTSLRKLPISGTKRHKTNLSERWLALRDLSSDWAHGSIRARDTIDARGKISYECRGYCLESNESDVEEPEPTNMISCYVGLSHGGMIHVLVNFVKLSYVGTYSTHCETSSTQTISRWVVAEF